MFFKQIIGHQKVKILFQNILEKSRLGNAYLFSGSEGIGKRTFALSLAKAFFCIKTQTDKPCEQCNNCTRINDNNFPDLINITADGKQIKIDQIRKLIRNITYYPIETEKRFVIIDDAHTMNIAAANSFLKTLEESSNHSVFILITPAISILPDTIKSRCQIVNFSPLKQNEISTILKKKNLDVDESVLQSLSSGSVSRALDLSKKINTDLLFKVIDRFSQLNPEDSVAIFNLSDSFSQEFKDIKDFIVILKLFFLDIMRSKQGLPPRLTETMVSQQSYKNILNLIEKKHSVDMLNKKLRFLNQMESSLGYNLNKKLSLEKILLELLQ